MSIILKLLEVFSFLTKEQVMNIIRIWNIIDNPSTIKKRGFFTLNPEKKHFLKKLSNGLQSCFAFQSLYVYCTAIPDYHRTVHQ